MKKRLLSLTLVVLLIFTAAPVPVQPVLAETPPCSQDGGPAGCIDLTLSPASLVGDVLVDGVPVAGQINTVRLSVAPNTPHTIEVNNFNDSTPGFNDLFNYNPASQKNVIVAAGKVRALTLKPGINYLKGYLKFTCDIRGLETGQAVACQPNVDGAGLPAVNPGETPSFAIANGDHTFHIDLVGPNADLWAPAALDVPIKIKGNVTTPLRSTFNRKGQLVVNLKVPGIVGDLFIDGQPIGGQVPTASLFVAPGPHTVEAKNIVDPAANGVYRWLDAILKSTVGTNQTRSVTLIPKKEFLLGFADVKCQINGFEAGRDVRCNLSVDGQGLGTLEAGQTQTFNLTPGDHTLNASVIGGNADLWAPAAQDVPVKISAGRSSRVTPTFNRKGILKITLSDPNVVADIFVDGVQVAGQVNSAEAAVAPNVRHTIDARTLRNVTAPDAFEYDDVAASATVAANQTRPAPVKIGKPREKCTGSMALLTVYNYMHTLLSLKMVGPETKTVRIDPNGGSQSVCVLPGDYQMTAIAPGYKVEADTHNIAAGGCWHLTYWDKRDAQPTGLSCNPDISQYHRP